MKTLIFAVVGLLVGTLGGTAYAGFKERDVLVAEMEAEKAAEKAAKRAAEDAAEGHDDEVDPSEVAAAEDHGEEDGGTPGDSAGAVDSDSLEDSESADPVSNQSGAEDDVHAAGQDQGEGQPAPDAQATAVPNTPPSPIPQRDPNLPPLGGNEGAMRLAKIFGAMKAPDAAKVLQNLSDREVQAILSHISDRKAAEILGNFEPERAASLSRLVLGSPGGEDQ